MSAFRIQRVNELVKRELSNLIRQRLPVETHGLISVTEVNIAKDLKTAQVFVSTVSVGPPDTAKVLASLERIRPFLQSHLSRTVVLKYTPHLEFKWDHGMERGQHLMEILEDLDKGQKA